MPDNNTQIPAARVPIWDQVTGFVTREWYRWFYNVYTAIETGRRYGSFCDTSTQSIAVINTAYPITLNSTATNLNAAPMTYGVYIGSPTSRVYVDTTANYNIQFSLQLYSSSAAAKNVSVWLRVNGADVANSAAVVSLKDSGTSAVAAWSFVTNLAAGNYFELVWSADNTAVTIQPSAASSPRPAIPGVIMTVNSLIGG